jgi:hypothetical protein
LYIFLHPIAKDPFAIFQTIFSTICVIFYKFICLPDPTYGSLLPPATACYRLLPHASQISAWTMGAWPPAIKWTSMLIFGLKQDMQQQGGTRSDQERPDICISDQ